LYAVAGALPDRGLAWAFAGDGIECDKGTVI
jgi:hypothetical protein